MENLLTNPGDFQRWADHPVTQAYLQFLRDRVQSLAMHWAQRVAPSDHPQMLAAQCQAETLGDLAQLTVNDVRVFYNLSELKEGETE